MNVVDSSCWIEYLANSDIGDLVAAAIETPEDLIVPAITIYEVYRKLAHEKGEKYAPITTKPGGGVFRQAIYWPFRDISLYGRGMVLRPVVSAPAKETRYGDSPLVHCAVVWNEEAGEITLFALNTSTRDDAETTVNLTSFGKTSLLCRTELSGGLKAVNSFDAPDAVSPVAVPPDPSAGSGSVYTFRLKKASWNVLRFKIG
jgi:alpha-N-arabinofuranosidase